MSLAGLGGLGGSSAQQYECSRAGCRASASIALLWRNPRIHTPERRKTWLACDEHVDVLSAFLAERTFLIETKSIGELGD